MSEREAGSGRKKLGALGCLVFWGLAVWAYFWMRRTPELKAVFSTVQGWVDALRAESPWWLAALLGLVVVSPAGLIWLVWRKVRSRKRDG